MTAHTCDHCGTPMPDTQMVMRIICPACDDFTRAKVCAVLHAYAYQRIATVKTLEEAKALTLESEHVNRFADFLLTQLGLVEDEEPLAPEHQPGAPYMADLILDDTIDDEELAQ